MKKQIVFGLLTLASSVVAQEAATHLAPAADAALVAEKAQVKPSYAYLRLGMNDTQAIEKVQVLPGVGLGYRLGVGPGVVDISASFTGTAQKLEDQPSYYYTLPKASYLYQWDQEAANTAYFGLGAAAVGMKQEAQKFLGAAACATVGAEMARLGAVRSFVELNVSQPVYAYSSDFAKLPGPVAEVALGLGF
jgi:hypothetical protein